MRHIILSVNTDLEYLYYAPLTIWAWRHFGWAPTLLYHRDSERRDLEALVMKTIRDLDPLVNIVPLQGIEGVRSGTVTQVSRLYGACVTSEDDYVMLGDIDMLPLSDYWKPNPDVLTIYGHDLTDFNEIPICYIGAKREKWFKMMQMDAGDPNRFIKRDLDVWPNAKSALFSEYWGTDQQIVTQRIKNYHANKEYIHRGYNKKRLAFGRVDRAAWKIKLPFYIDAHLFHGAYMALGKHRNRANAKQFSRTLQLLRLIWPQEDFQWFVAYTQQYARWAEEATELHNPEPASLPRGWFRLGAPVANRQGKPVSPPAGKILSTPQTR